MFSRNETFPVHCRPLQGPPASGVFFINSNSDSEKGWVFLFWNKNREGAAQGLICLMCLWLCICIYICVFCFASTRWWVLWEIRDYSGTPCVCDTAFANTCLLICICCSVFVTLYLCICLWQHEVASPLGNPGLLGASAGKRTVINYTTTCKWEHLLNPYPCIDGTWILDCHLQL